MAEASRRSETYPNAPGVALIINNAIFENAAPRPGTHQDAQSLKDLFDVMNFKIQIKDNCRCPEEMYDCIKSAVGLFDDTTHFGAFFLCILTHGAEDGLQFTDGSRKSVDVIMSYLSSNRGLLRKAKIIIVQACRGDDHMTVGKNGGCVPVRHQEFRIDGNSTSGDSQAHFMVFSSCIPGRVSYIHPKYGSWFITVFCDVVLERMQRQTTPVPIQEIVTDVNGVMQDTMYFKSTKVYKTCELSRYTLGKTLYLRADYMNNKLNVAANRVRGLRLKLQELSRSGRSNEVTRDDAPTHTPTNNITSPPAVLVTCRCEKGCQPGSNCSCRREGTPCHPKCHKPKGSSCSNSGDVDVEELSASLASALTLSASKGKAAGSAATASRRCGPTATAVPLTPSRTQPSEAARRLDSDEDVVCQCSGSCLTSTCPCKADDVVCVADCHDGMDCSNAVTCSCAKTSCQTKRCSCFRDGWHCTEDCHPNSECCENLNSTAAKRRARR